MPLDHRLLVCGVALAINLVSYFIAIRETGDETRADEALARYRGIDKEVYATLAADEAQLMRS